MLKYMNLLTQATIYKLLTTNRCIENYYSMRFRCINILRFLGFQVAHLGMFTFFTCLHHKWTAMCWCFHGNPCYTCGHNPDSDFPQAWDWILCNEDCAMLPTTTNVLVLFSNLQKLPALVVGLLEFLNFRVGTFTPSVYLVFQYNDWLVILVPKHVN